jgi:hypothetical protein
MPSDLDLNRRHIESVYCRPHGSSNVNCLPTDQAERSGVRGLVARVCANFAPYCSRNWVYWRAKLRAHRVGRDFADDKTMTPWTSEAKKGIGFPGKRRAMELGLLPHLDQGVTEFRVARGVNICRGIQYQVARQRQARMQVSDTSRWHWQSKATHSGPTKLSSRLFL